MLRRLQLLVFRAYRRLPVRARRFVVRRLTPSFSVGAMCVVEREDGALLLVRHSYRRRWGFPGGLLARKEDPADAARREAREEVGLEVEICGEPAVVVDPVPRRVDVIFRARPARSDPSARLSPRSAEILEARWFAPDELPELQAEAAAALVELARWERRAAATPPPAPPPIRSARDTGTGAVQRTAERTTGGRHG